MPEPVEIRLDLERLARRRRNGNALDSLRELGLEPERRPPELVDPPEPRWIMAAAATALALFALVALGLWKLVELVSRAT